MVRPLLLLDVEAVLTPFDVDQSRPGFVPVGLYPDEEIVSINPQHGIWVDELAARYEIVWASSWNDEANRLFAPLLDIDPMAMLALPDGSAPGPDPALDVVARFVRGSAACWIDDSHSPARHGWAEEREEPTLLLTATSATGLTRDLVDAALAFVDAAQIRSDMTLQR